MFVKIIENINDLIEIFEEIAGDIDIDGKDKDFVEIRFTKEEIKNIVRSLKELKQNDETRSIGRIEGPRPLCWLG